MAHGVRAAIPGGTPGFPGMDGAQTGSHWSHPGQEPLVGTRDGGAGIAATSSRGIKWCVRGMVPGVLPIPWKPDKPGLTDQALKLRSKGPDVEIMRNDDANASPQ